MSIHKIPHLIKDSGTQIRNMIDHSIDYMRLEITEKMVLIGSSLLSGVILLFFGFSFVLLLSIGISIYLGDIIGSYPLGFCIMAAVFLLGGIVFIFNKKWMVRDPFLKGVMSQMDKDEDDGEEGGNHG